MAATKNSFKWTSAQEQALIQCYQTDGPKKLSEDLGISYWVLLSKAKRLGIAATRRCPPKGFKWDDEVISAIKERYVKEGGDKLATDFGITLGMVQRKASTMGLHTIAGHKRWGRERAENNASCDIHYFDRWSPNMAYILGFLFADGSVDKHMHTVGVCMKAEDRSVVDFIRTELKSIYEPRVTPARGNDKPQIQFGLHSTIIAEQLGRLGLHPRKTYNDNPFPDVPEDMLPHFIRGVFDGDGCASNGVGFATSPKLLIGIRDALMRHAEMSYQPVHLHKGKTATWADVGWSQWRDLKLYYAFAYPADFGFCLERKRRKLEESIAGRKQDRQKYFWTTEEEEQVVNLYHLLGAKKLSVLLNKPRSAIRYKAGMLELAPMSTKQRERLRRA